MILTSLRSLLLFLVALSSFSALHSEALPLLTVPQKAITASEYCDFLNRTAASDPDHFYDEKMEGDPLEGSIVRTGEPGFFHYEVIEGQEMKPVTYVNTADQIAYCKESGNIGAPSFIDFRLGDIRRADTFFASNQSPFFIASQSNKEILSLGVSSDTQDSFRSTLKEVSASVLFALVCYKLYTVIGTHAPRLNPQLNNQNVLTRLPDLEMNRVGLSTIEPDSDLGQIQPGNSAVPGEYIPAIPSAPPMDTTQDVLHNLTTSIEPDLVAAVKEISLNSEENSEENEFLEKKRKALLQAAEELNKDHPRVKSVQNFSEAAAIYDLIHQQPKDEDPNSALSRMKLLADEIAESFLELGEKISNNESVSDDAFYTLIKIKNMMTKEFSKRSLDKDFLAIGFRYQMLAHTYIHDPSNHSRIELLQQELEKVLQKQLEKYSVFTTP